MSVVVAVGDRDFAVWADERDLETEVLERIQSAGVGGECEFVS